MKNFKLLLFFVALSGTKLLAQSTFGEYKSLDVFLNFSLLDNNQYGPETVPRRLHFGGGVGGGISINDNFNLLLGLNFLQVKPNNTRSDYTFCPDLSCLPIAVSNQLFLPIGAEYYTNTNQSPFQMFWALRLVPSFSVTEVTEIIPFDYYQSPRPSIFVKNNGFKFQDLQFQVAVNNEFSINQKYKIYVEPSVSHSILFRAEDAINADYIVSLKVGFKIRKRK
jgi:hypothetical protein